ncbi:SGNH/GDSL hydrolase family protein [Methylobacterium sp. SyP6R]|uniref:SGNH/GDSL hydrolase family protein n=1 Tax=Methylobacterium sp. SyP6R TaxID=2718876 RepID=UPI001F3CA93C|nr:SGNH/GDSL hydrolase family protein [Methylobacterium sp. SyP6R]MCF4129044.1 SGNH/GDSL hydrolase family protein [Methylobacterium sp. SyP6R]
MLRRSHLGRMACLSATILAGHLVAVLPAAACPASLPPAAERMSLDVTEAHVARREAVRVLAIGSSSTEGIGASAPDRTYPHLLEQSLRTAWRGTPVAVTNAGIGGETADQTLARLSEALKQPVKPDLVIWQVGTNDAITGGSEAAFRGRLEQGIALVRAAGSDLIILDQQYYPAIPDHARYERFVGLVASVATGAEVPVFSRYALMKDWNRQDPGLLDGMLSSDKFHMGDQGYACLAQALGRDILNAVTPRPDPFQAVARAKREKLPDQVTLKRG